MGVLPDTPPPTLFVRSNFVILSKLEKLGASPLNVFSYGIKYNKSVAFRLPCIITDVFEKHMK
jgi:hypothetical protein